MATLAASPTQTSPAARAGLWLARAGWVCAFLFVAAVLIEMVPTNYGDTYPEWDVQQAYWGVQPWLTYPQWVRVIVALEYVSTAVFVGTALLIVWRRWDDWFAVMVSSVLLLLGLTFGIHGNIDTLRLAGVPWWLYRQWRWLLPFFFSIGLFAIFYLFPNGRFVPRWTRWALLATSIVLLAGWPGEVIADALGWGKAWQQWEIPWGLFMATFLVSLAIGFGAQIYRYRRVATVVERQQTKWVIYGIGVGFGLLILTMATDSLWSEMRTPALDVTLTGLRLMETVAILALPLSISLSILRYGLWSVDRVINRTLVYALMTGAVFAVYGLLVGISAAFLGLGGSPWLAVVATAIVAAIFQPLRDWLQRSVNQLSYGARDDPITVLRLLGRHLESTAAPDATLETMTRTVAESLKLPYAALELAHEGETGELARATVAVWGKPAGALERFPLVFQSAPLGHLVVSERAEGERLGHADRALLESVALQAGPAVQAMQLTAQLQQSRQAIVTAREEERRRLRRELHDGLGPQLASQTLTIDAIARQMERDPARAAALLQDLKHQSQDAIRDIREIVYELRPPALDDLGLVGAIEESAHRAEQAGVVVGVEAGDLPPLPAAVEAAAYRIVQEAMTNSLRHAGPTQIAVRLRATGSALEIEIEDDGGGMAAGTRPGVGIRSMRERAEELGGALQIDSPAGEAARGTRVRAALPLERPAAAGRSMT